MESETSIEPISSIIENFSINEFYPPLHTAVPFISKTTNLYANLYKIQITKSLLLYEYAIKFEVDFPEISTRVKRKVILKINKEISDEYGIFIYTGNSLFCSNKIEKIEKKEVIINEFKYTFSIHPTKEIIELTNDVKQMNKLYKERQEVKTILEVIIKDILSHNPSLKFIKNLYGKKNEEKKVTATQDYNTIKVMPGFVTKVMFLEEGIFLNVDIKNKIVSSYDCLYLINTFIANKGKPTKEEMKAINSFFSGRTVETIHTGQRFKIDLVNFERRAKNYDVKYDNKSISITKFYKAIFDINLNPDSPLLLIQTKRKKDNQSVGRYFPPELCLLVGLTEDMLKDTYLLKNMTKEVKLCPDDKVTSIKDIIKLINEKKNIVLKKKTDKGELYEEKMKSSFEKKNEYGIDLIDVTNESLFTGGVLQDPTIYGENNKIIKSLMKPFQLYQSKEINFFCIYHKLNERDKNTMNNLFLTAGKSYNIRFGLMDYRSTNSENPKEWMSIINKMQNSNKYNVIIVLIDDYLKGLGLYDLIKQSSMETLGYITQFILTKSLYKNALSVMSNILIQINTKIGGLSYSIDFSKITNGKQYMIVGVDSSHFYENGDRYLKLAICSTMNESFTQYFSQKEIHKEQYGEKVALSLSKYIYYALGEFFKANRKLPEGVIIYRQGVSKEQKQYLSNEIEEINNLMMGKSDLLKNANVPYYYVLVNKKTTLKFFEHSMNEKNKYKKFSVYDNPEPGLLVYEKIVDPTIFEFYIQPQKVTSGTATPTNFHVAYGNMKNPEMIPILTYYLCFLYSNWRGPVRVPAPLKYAEKLAKVPQKLNEKIKNKLVYI